MPKQGFIQTLIIIALLIIILSLLGVSLSSLFTDTLIKENFFFVGAWLVKAWNSSVEFFKEVFDAEEKTPENTATSTNSQ